MYQPVYPASLAYHVSTMVIHTPKKSYKHHLNPLNWNTAKNLFDTHSFKNINITNIRKNAPLISNDSIKHCTQRIKMMIESIQRGKFAKYLFLGDGLLENRICFYKILRKISWNIWSVLMVFLFLENVMCSNEILNKISWKILICSYDIFSS